MLDRARRSCARTVAAALVVLGSSSGHAAAGTATAALTVQVVVQPACTVSGATLDFGTYRSGQTDDLRGYTQLMFSSCQAGALRFELDQGVNGSITARKMSDGRGALLGYAIYRDSARTQTFGSGVNSKTVTLSAAGSGAVSVYGVIAGRQVVPAGTYTDTVNVTLTF
jgi:spore coat protein U-like protein